MRVLVLVLAVLAASCDAYSNSFLLQEPIAGGSSNGGDQLVGFFEKLKDWMKKGHDKPAIPVLDPLKKDHLELNVDNEKMGIAVEGAVDNLRALGLSDFVVNRADFRLAGLQANVDLTWKNIDFFTMYKITKGKIPPQMALYGEGAILAIAKDLQVAVEVRLTVNTDGKLYVRDIDLKIQLGELDFNATGLLYDEELSKIISQIISELVPQVLRDWPAEVSTNGGKLLKKVLDQVLSKLTITDLIEIIGS
ncbi:uncharacterized protein LOC143356177 [Halictus rubicundus]|uniref:uncharacterized protein LOC143356177 n=1 Tax=Halictus rubicundus TaxID=77578 RepID=UPI004036BE15